MAYQKISVIFLKKISESKMIIVLNCYSHGPNVWPKFAPLETSNIIFRQNRPEKSARNRIFYFVLLTLSVTLSIISFYGASLWHHPEITPSGYNFVLGSKYFFKTTLKCENFKILSLNFDNLILSTRMDIAVWNAMVRSLWSLGLGNIFQKVLKTRGYLPTY